MNKYFRYVIQSVDYLNKFIELLCNFLLVLMILLVVFQVVFRYLLHSPISWSEEVAIFMLVWFGLLSVATAVYRHGHISIGFVRDRLSKNGQYLLDMAVQFLILIFSLNIMLNSTMLVSLVGSERLPASGIFRAYLYFAPMVAGALMVINSIANILWNAEPDRHIEVQQQLLATSPAADVSKGIDK